MKTSHFKFDQISHAHLWCTSIMNNWSDKMTRNPENLTMKNDSKPILMLIRIFQYIFTIDTIHWLSWVDWAESLSWHWKFVKCWNSCWTVNNEQLCVSSSYDISTYISICSLPTADTLEQQTLNDINIIWDESLKRTDTCALYNSHCNIEHAKFKARQTLDIFPLLHTIAIAMRDVCILHYEKSPGRWITIRWESKGKKNHFERKSFPLNGFSLPFVKRNPKTCLSSHYWRIKKWTKSIDLIKYAKRCHWCNRNSPHIHWANYESNRWMNCDSNNWTSVDLTANNGIG